ncbi:unnamed protein product, partial [Prorocentrum cordatum]
AFAEEAPTLRRAFEQDFKKADAGAELEVKFETFSAEVWGTDASASTDQVLVSLGRGAESLEGMTTNSMSGEFFFQSRDGRFFVKTISEPEGDLLRQMAPAYRAHMRGCSAISAGRAPEALTPAAPAHANGAQCA